MVLSAIDDNQSTTTATSTSNNGAYYYYIYGIILILFVMMLQRLTAMVGNSNSSSTHHSRRRYQQQHQSLLYTSFSLESKRRIQHGMTGCILVLISYCIPIYICIVLLIIATYLIYYIKTYYFSTIYIQNFGPLLRDHEKQQPSISSSSSENHSDTISSSLSHDIPLPGAYYFLLGTTITTILFPIHIARYSVLCLSLADPIAAYIGQTIPSYRIDTISVFFIRRMFTFFNISTNGTISGCIACFITAWCVGYITFIVLPQQQQYTTTTATTTTSSFILQFDHPIMAITAGAMTCCIAEAIPFFGNNKYIGNDNLQIPVLTAFIVTMFLK